MTSDPKGESCQSGMSLEWNLQQRSSYIFLVKVDYLYCLLVREGVAPKQAQSNRIEFAGSIFKITKECCKQPLKC